MSKMDRNIQGVGSGWVGILRISWIFLGMIRMVTGGPWEYYLGGLGVPGTIIWGSPGVKKAPRSFHLTGAQNFLRIRQLSPVVTIMPDSVVPQEIARAC